MQRSLDGEERAGSFAVPVLLRWRGLLGLWGCFVCCSLSGGSLLLHPSSLPLKGNVVFSPGLDVAVGQVGGHKRKYAAMMLPSSRAGVKVCMLSLPSRRPVLLVGLVFSVSVFAGWPSWVASRPDGETDSLKFSGGREFPCRVS